MNYIFITNKPDLANYAVESGASRIMVDLEVNGKSERQKSRNTLISDHAVEDIGKIKLINRGIFTICRINPVYHGTANEVESALANGADSIMLPMFTACDEVEYVYRLIDRRAKLILLFETPQALVRSEEIVASKFLDEAYIGLNDLSLAIGIEFMFELFCSDLLSNLARVFRMSKIPFGIGGIAKYGEGIARSELIMSEHVRLGSSSVILSRSFHEYSVSVAELESKIDFKTEIYKLNQCRLNCANSGEAKLNQNKMILKDEVCAYVKHLRRKSFSVATG